MIICGFIGNGCHRWTEMPVMAQIKAIRLRWRLRTLLAVIALLALFMWAGELWRRRARYLRLSAEHESLEFSYRLMEQMNRSIPVGGPDETGIRSDASSFLGIGPEAARREAETAQYHSQLKRKYEYAASHPWFFIAADPAPPERFRRTP